MSGALQGKQWASFLMNRQLNQLPEVSQMLAFAPGAFRMGTEPFFKRIDNSRPYEPLHMTTALWASVPVVTVDLTNVIASQYEVTSSFLLNSRDHPGNNTSFGGDAYPLFVRFRGETYLVDGHHRVSAALASGQRTVLGRMLSR